MDNLFEEKKGAFNTLIEKEIDKKLKPIYAELWSLKIVLLELIKKENKGKGF